MANPTRQAILQALVEGVVTDMMIKTTGEQVYLDDTTTLSSKIAEMIVAINARAKSDDVTAQIAALKQEILGDTPVAAYDTFTELAAYIAEHKDVSDALTAAIGNKADASLVADIQTVINGLGDLATKSKVSESDLDDTLQAKIQAAYNGENNHTHTNKDVLDGITAEKVSEWDSKGTVFVATDQPTDLAAGDLFIKLVN